MNKKEELKKLFASREGIIFDFDGLLVDSEPFHYKAYNAAFQEYGHTIDPEEYWVEFTSKGGGAPGEIERHGLKGLDPLEIRRKKFIYYSEYCRKGDVKFFPLAKELLQRAKEAGYKLAIASGSRNDDLHAILQMNGFTNTFHAILGKESAPREKPAPDLFVLAAKELGINPVRLVVLEDAEKGLLASKSAGIPCVIVRNKLNLDIPFPDADFICDGLEDVIEAIAAKIGKDTEKKI